MTMLPGLARLDGLFELDQKGVDIRPILLRVLTDQYFASLRHTPEEEQRYSELAMRLINETDVASRAAVAARLARQPAAPRAIVLRLAGDMLEVAEPILRFSPCLTLADCAAIASECGPAHAGLLVERSKSPPTAEVIAPAAKPAQASPPAASEATELCEMFFTAGSAERRLILLMLDYVPEAPPAPAPSLQPSD